MATAATTRKPADPPIDDAQFRILADNLPTLCWFADAEGTITWVNRRWTEYTGTTSAVMAQRGWRAVHDPDRLPELIDAVRPAVRAGEPFDLVADLRGADGVYRPFLSHLQPVRDADGRLTGWVGTCTEISEQLETERNQAFLLRLGDRIRAEADPVAILTLTSEAIGTYLATSRVVFAEIDPTATEMFVWRDWHDDGRSQPDHTIAVSVFGEELVAAHSRGETIAVADVTADPRVPESLRRALAGIGMQSFLTVPLVKGGRLVALMALQQNRPRHWTQAEERLLCEVAERTWATLERARVQADLAVAERRQAFLLALGDRLRAESEPATILAQAAQALGDYFGARHVIYSEVEDNDTHLDIKHSWSDGDMPARSGRWRLSVMGDEIMAAYRHGESVAVDDIEANPRLPEELREGFRTYGVHAYVTVPVRKGGRLRALLSIQMGERRAWSASDIEIVEAAAERSWEALERARAVHALRDSEKLFRMVTEAHPLPVVIAQGDGLVLANPAFFEMLRLPNGDPRGSDPKTWIGWDGGWDDLVAFVRAHPRLDNYETMMARDGHPFPVSMSWRHVFYNGAPAVIASVLDLTETKRAQAELQRSREALHQAEKLSALGSLLAGVSHELNNPLSVVTTQASLLEEMAEGTDLADRAAKVRRAAERCSRIVQTFLAMARQKRPERQIVAAADIARAALDLTDYSLRTAGVRVTCEITPDLPPLHADPDQLHQVLVNLIVNAQHALQEVTGPRDLTVRVLRAREPCRINIEVADNGPGIPDDIRRRVFEPFFTTKPQGVGTGVGLSFSLGLVEAHGGRLELVDQPQGGTCFRITLDVADAAPEPACPPDEAAAAADRRGTALVVDDEPELAEVLAIFVGRAGYRVDMAANGIEAQQRLRDADYDLILTDLRMPGLDGPGLYEWIERERPHLLGRIGFVTGDTLGASAARFIGRTGCPVVEKPFTVDGIRDVVRQLGERTPAAAGA